MSTETDFVIIIDHKAYKIPPGTITGSQLRALPSPPIGPNFDLWQVVAGGDDIKIADNQVVVVGPGLEFYSAPTTINPGLAA